MSETIEKAMNLYITTTGRHSSESRFAHLWFGYEDGLVHLLSVVYENGRHTHWYENLRADPHCLLAVDGERYQAEVVAMAPDHATEQRIREMIRTKYGDGPYRQWFGDDPMVPVIMRVTGPAPHGVKATPYE